MSAMAMQSAAAFNRRKTCWLGTPEIYFRKTIDNSRLVKVEDPRRAREMKYFGLALCCLFLLVMGYALQHFRAIEYGYQIETATVAALRPYGNEPRSAPGRGVAARSGTNRRDGAQTGSAIATAWASASHGCSHRCRHAGDGQRDSGRGGVRALDQFSSSQFSVLSGP